LAPKELKRNIDRTIKIDEDYSYVELPYTAFDTDSNNSQDVITYSNKQNNYLTQKLFQKFELTVSHSPGRMKAWVSPFVKLKKI